MLCFKQPTFISLKFPGNTVYTFYKKVIRAAIQGVKKTSINTEVFLQNLRQGPV